MFLYCSNSFIPTKNLNTARTPTERIINFQPLPRKHDRVSLEVIHKNNSFSPDGLFVELKHHLSHNLSDAPNFYQISL